MIAFSAPKWILSALHSAIAVGKRDTLIEIRA